MHPREPLRPATPAAPAALVRRAASVLVVAHLFALFAAVTSYSSPNFPAPALAVRAAEPLQPYLQGTFLNNAYRFFAPNPGTPTVLWFRVQSRDRSVRWVEVPGRPDALTREPYQRRLNLAIQIAQHVVPDPTREGKATFTPTGQACLASFVRHVAHAHIRTQPDGKVAAVRNVGVYFVQHAVLSPEQVRAGWGPLDLRTYRPVFVGAFTPGGERTDEFRPDLVEQSIFHVAAGIVKIDVLPRLNGRGDATGLLDELGLPAPMHRFLVQHPELLAAGPAGDDLKARIEKVAAAGSR